jgi:hypothetical protein
MRLDRFPDRVGQLLPERPGELCDQLGSQKPQVLTLLGDRTQLTLPDFFEAMKNDPAFDLLAKRAYPPVHSSGAHSKRNK